MTDGSSPGFVLANPGRLHLNPPAAVLVEHAVRRGEGELTSLGAFAALTGARTGRSPKDKYTVRDGLTAPRVDWAANKPMEPAQFNRLAALAQAYLQNRELFVFDGYAAAHPAHRLPIRVVTERAWHSLFARCLFLRPTPAELTGFVPEWTVVHAADLKFDPGRDGTNSDALVALDFSRKLVLVAGTHYAGEIKKAIFTVMNFLLPERGVLSMHCSANVGAAGDVALFFGLSGTGKTTLSADPDRRLIGDDEHGWGDDGVFNIEGGCYAKTIRLSAAGEPQIYHALRFGCVLENVPTDPATRVPDFDSLRYTENTRAAYPVDFIPNADPSGRGGHPRNVFFLTCDASGLLPPLARLTPRQAMDYFLCGYTARVAGTEVGLTESVPEFSTCFGKPFLPLPPKRYAELLRAKLEAHAAPVWLVNTGWTGGPPGIGSRMALAHTRALLKAVLTGELADVPFAAEPAFGLAVPARCPGVPDRVLRPREAWADPAAYDREAAKLAARFQAEAAKYQ